MNKLGELLKQADALKTVAQMKDGWDEESAKKYEAILGEADKAKLQLALEAKHEELRELANKPDGKSVVMQGFGREAAPMEGVIEGVTQDYSSGSYELLATDSAGKSKLEALKSGLYKDAFRDYLRLATRFGSEWRSQMKGDALKVLQVGQDTAGGFWSPPDVRAELVKKIATTATIRPNAYAFTTGSDMVTFPKVVYTTDDKFTTGARFSWTAEAPAAAISEATNPAAGRISIPVHTATCAIIVTRAMIEDNHFDILGYISSILGETYALGEEDAFIAGDGVGKPQGITKHASASVAHASGGMYVVSGSSGAVTWGGTTATALDSTKGLLGVEAALPPQYENGAKWYFNKATKAAIRALTDQNGRPIWQPGDVYPSLANGYHPTLLGFPFAQAQFMPALASDSLSVMLGDLQGYFIADRVGLSVEVLREIRALQDEVVVYARKRVGAQLVRPWMVKLLKAGTS